MQLSCLPKPTFKTGPDHISSISVTHCFEIVLNCFSPSVWCDMLPTGSYRYITSAILQLTVVRDVLSNSNNTDSRSYNLCYTLYSKLILMVRLLLKGTVLVGVHLIHSDGSSFSLFFSTITICTLLNLNSAFHV